MSLREAHLIYLLEKLYDSRQPEVKNQDGSRQARTVELTLVSQLATKELRRYLGFITRGCVVLSHHYRSVGLQGHENITIS